MPAAFLSLSLADNLTANELEPSSALFLLVGVCLRGSDQHREGSQQFPSQFVSGPAGDKQWSGGPHLPAHQPQARRRGLEGEDVEARPEHQDQPCLLWDKGGRELLQCRVRSEGGEKPV